jgi:hypothetical protein
MKPKTSVVGKFVDDLDDLDKFVDDLDDLSNHASTA